MANEIQKFDLTDHIRQKVREVLVSSIPDDRMDAMIKMEYDKFFSASQDNYNRSAPSPFGALVREELETTIKTQVREWLASNFKEQRSEDNTYRLIGEAVTKFTPLVQQAMVVEMTQRVLAVLISSSDENKGWQEHRSNITAVIYGRD